MTNKQQQQNGIVNHDPIGASYNGDEEHHKLTPVHWWLGKTCTVEDLITTMAVFCQTSGISLNDPRSMEFGWWVMLSGAGNCMKTHICLSPLTHDARTTQEIRQ